MLLDKKSVVNYGEVEHVRTCWINSKEFGWIEVGVFEQIVEYDEIVGFRRWMEEEGLGFIHGYVDVWIRGVSYVLNIKDNFVEVVDKIWREGVK